MIGLTTKRFKIIIGEFEEENIMDAVKKIEITEISDMCTQMNALHEENTHLKTEINTYKAGNTTIHERLKQLHKENQQLKEEIKDFQNLLQAKEETYLKPIYVALDEAITNERTHIGRNVLKQFKQTIME